MRDSLRPAEHGEGMARNLGAICGDKNNNMNLIRFCAASAVLVSHSFALATGSAAAEPLRGLIGMTPGSMAVDVFFVLSGFLVTRSLVERGSILAFIKARILRIYPALLVSVVITVAVAGLFFTTLGAKDFLLNDKTIEYLKYNSTIFWGYASFLPGVFEGNPFGAGVNGSLWTLPREVHLYYKLALAWILFSISKSRRTFVSIFVVCVAVGGLPYMLLKDGGRFVEGSDWRLGYLFFSGGAYYVLRKWIALDWRAFAVCAASIVLAYHQGYFFPVYSLVVPYMVLCLAYAPSGFLKHYNRAGDYSYGMYIYAFPVQQSLAAAVQGIGAWALMFASFAVTLLLAFVSWNMIEQRCLRFKNVRMTDALPEGLRTRIRALAESAGALRYRMKNY